MDCPHCGVSIEFWKDEPSLKCSACKKLVVNPKLDLGCATWCQYAEQCLGTMSSNDDILCKRLIREAVIFKSSEVRIGWAEVSMEPAATSREDCSMMSAIWPNVRPYSRNRSSGTSTWVT